MGEEPNSSILSWANLAWNRCFKSKTWNWKVNIYPGSLTRDTEVPTGESSEVEGSKCGRKKEAGTRWGDWVRGEDAGPILHQKLMLSKLVKRSRREPPPPQAHDTCQQPRVPCFLPVFFLHNRHCTNTGPLWSGGGGSSELWHLPGFTRSAKPLITGGSTSAAALYRQRCPNCCI